MAPQTVFLFIVAACLTNGLVSPMLGPIFGLWPLWYPQVITPVPELVFYGASVIVSTTTGRCGSGWPARRRCCCSASPDARGSADPTQSWRDLGSYVRVDAFPMARKPLAGNPIEHRIQLYFTTYPWL